ncbi:SHOCT domain-containing protein [Sphingomonas sp. PAMC 26617]|uniref:SHOCT domain-containing protein n=1 Tax=Sphingomonas sp. PAMC 26617 TaxID=1112216 RepID=UPI0005665942|nr:SHOCT domain-containing protein [Sphingomonas sp. PAMC 26617]
MTATNWNDWYFGWDWLLWVGFVVLLFSGLGNWGYTYRAQRRYDVAPAKGALTILDERYARGEIARDEYLQIKSEISDGKA